MSEMKIGRERDERFHAPEEQVPAGREALVERRDHRPLGGILQVNQGVSAEDNVKNRKGGEPRRLDQVHPSEGDATPHVLPNPVAARRLQLEESRTPVFGSLSER